MIYKEKLRALIERRRKDWRYGNSVEAKYKAEECDDILELIDSLHEEPKFKVGDIIKHKHYEHWETEEVIEVTAQGVRTNIGWLSFPDEWELVEEPKKKEPVSGNIDFDKELYKAFGQIKDFTLGIAIAKRFYDMGRKHNEPVSEDLEKAANEWNTKASFTPFYMVLDDNGNPNEVRQDYTTHAESFKAGAKWQKEKEYTCYEEAFEDGASWKKEEMMKGAIDATVHIDSGNYPYIPQIELYDYDKDVPLAKEGDKYKVVLIKEE